MNIALAPLAGRRGLVVGPAQSAGPAWVCARRLGALGARLVLGCPQAGAVAGLASLARRIDAPLIAVDGARRGAVEAMVEASAREIDHFDFVIHGWQLAPSVEPHARHTAGPDEQLLVALHGACRSTMQITRLCAPHMPRGGVVVAMHRLARPGAGSATASRSTAESAFESILRYFALGLEPWGLRLHPLSVAGAADRDADDGIGDRVAALVEPPSVSAPPRVHHRIGAPAWQ